MSNKTINHIGENFKKISTIYKDHYIAASTMSIFLFTVICYVYDTSYLSRFGIDFWMFGDLTDVYQITLSSNVMLLIFTFSQLIITFSIIAIRYISYTVSTESKPSFFNKNGVVQITIAILLPVIIISLWLLLLLTSKIDAEKLKEGFAARYNIHTDKKTMSCHSIIGSTSNYLFLWDNENKRPKIIPRSIVNELDFVIPPQPEWRLATKSFGEQYERQKEELLKKQQEWSEILNKRCNHSVEWKEW